MNYVQFAKVLGAVNSTCYLPLNEGQYQMRYCIFLSVREIAHSMGILDPRVIWGVASVVYHI